QLLLGLEVAVDDGLVDADRLGDLLHRRVLQPALVEQAAGRIDDLALATAASRRSAGLCRSHARNCNRRLQNQLQFVPWKPPPPSPPPPPRRPPPSSRSS